MQNADAHLWIVGILDVQYVQRKYAAVFLVEKNIQYVDSNLRSLYATALAIEVLCICAAETGENSSFLIFGYKTILGITLGYILGFCNNP